MNAIIPTTVFDWCSTILSLTSIFQCCGCCKNCCCCGCWKRKDVDVLVLALEKVLSLKKSVVVIVVAFCCWRAVYVAIGRVFKFVTAVERILVLLLMKSCYCCWWKRCCWKGIATLVVLMFLLLWCWKWWLMLLLNKREDVDAVFVVEKMLLLLLCCWKWMLMLL